ncbi:hypothetical protein M1563_04220 [Patescibacteria group bacterium]|nr:hypothetical protein [Patescibacteria group bacterium]
MPKLIFKKRVLPDAGKVSAKLVSVIEVENKFYNPKEQSSDREKQLEWVFEYEEKPGMQIRLWSTFSLSSYKGRKSKALTITEALLNHELTDEEKENFTTDELIGKKCFLTVKHEKKEDGAIFAKVIDFESEA